MRLTTVVLITAALAQIALALSSWLRGNTKQAWVNVGLAVLWIVVLKMASRNSRA